MALPVLLGIDDTDTAQGGCTTHTALMVAAAVDAAGGALAAWHLVDAPRLVRLDPAAPHRTRGNGALVLPIGPAGAAEVRVGQHEGRELWVHRPQADAPLKPAAVDQLQAIADRLLPAPDAAGGDPQPCAVLVPTAPGASLYTRAVHRLVDHGSALAAAPRASHWLTPPQRRGAVGALCATAWPMTRWTWEAIAYRRIDERVPERTLPDGFHAALAALPGGFDNVMPAQRRPRAVPATPCPVRWAARGLDARALVEATLGWTNTDEPSDAGSWWLLRTNQATGDHARHADATRAPHKVVVDAVTITAAPRTMRGGHVFVAATSADGAPVRLAAFEPTKGLRSVVRALVAGDRLRVLARTNIHADTWALEALRVDALATVLQPAGNPHCCGKAMKSRGSAAGFRCVHCHARRPASGREEVDVPRALGPHTFTQVPDHVRGHLLPPADGLRAANGLTDRELVRSEAIPAVFAHATAKPTPL